MKVVIEGDAKEIASLVTTLQEHGKVSKVDAQELVEYFTHLLELRNRTFE